MSKKEYMRLKRRIAHEERVKILKAIVLIILAIVSINFLSECNASVMNDDMLKSELTAETGMWTKDTWLKYNQTINE